MSSQRHAQGPFDPSLNFALSEAFGQDVSGLNASFGDSSLNSGIGAAAHATHAGMSFGGGIQQDMSDPFSMEVIGHEVAHMLGGVGTGETLLDQAGDPGEAKANVAGRGFSDWVTGGMQGRTPTLDAATGGRATVHRFALGGLGEIKDGVHEEVTRQAIEAAGGERNTGGFTDQNTELLRGVYWNDDPAGHMFSNNANRTDGENNADFSARGSLEWYRQFDSQGRGAQPGVGDEITGRSHHGDLQFLHGMASGAGEDPEVTRAKMQMWADFTTSVATGQVAGDANISDMGEDFAAMFPDRANMTVEQFFGIQDGNGNVQDRAMGSLLHMVQDSHAEGHVERDADGKIVNFHSYDRQDHHAHGESDNLDEHGHLPHGGQAAIDQSAALLRIHNDQSLSGPERQAAMRELLNRDTLALSENVRPAEAGEPYEKHEEEHGFFGELWEDTKQFGHDALVYGSRDVELLASGIDVVDNAWDWTRNTVGDGIDAASEWGGRQWDGAVEGWNDLTDWGGNMVDRASDGIDQGWNAAQDWGRGVGNDINQGWNDVQDWGRGVGDDVNQGWNDVQDWGRGVGNDVSEGWGDLKQWGSDTANRAGEAINTGWNDLGTWGTGVGNDISEGWGSAKEWGSNTLDSASETISGGIDSAGSALRDGWDAVSSW